MGNKVKIQAICPHCKKEGTMILTDDNIMDILMYNFENLTTKSKASEHNSRKNQSAKLKKRFMKTLKNLPKTHSHIYDKYTKAD